MEPKKTYKTIGNPKGRGFWLGGVPANYTGRILDGRTIDVPVEVPPCQEGQVTEEYAFWSTLQAERQGFKTGLYTGLGIGLFLLFIISNLIQ